MKLFWLLSLVCHVLFSSQGLVGARFMDVEEYPNIKICNGDTGGDLVSYHDANDAYQRFREIYGNCTHIIGNLIINDLKPVDKSGKVLDYSFLESIVEVNGFVRITANSIKRIPLTNLRVIRGFMKFDSNDQLLDRGNALYIGFNQVSSRVEDHDADSFTAEIDLRNLQSILHSNVSVDSNFGLCYLPRTINWSYILHDSGKQHLSIQGEAFNADFCKGGASCHESCVPVNGKRYCWGPREDQCQKIVQCDRSKCDNGRGLCFFETVKSGKDKVRVQRCCNKECTAGCTGPEATDCFACRNFLNGKECVRGCPTRMEYDKVTYMERPNPNPRYTFGSLCVKQCPRMALTGDLHCYASCNFRTHYLKDGNKCLKCRGNKCKDNCIIDDLRKKINVTSTPFTPRSLLKQLRNCVHVQGNIRIFDASYLVKKKKKKHLKDELVRPQDLENLKNIRTFVGQMYLDLNYRSYPTIKNLSFLSNLETLRSSKDGFQLSQSNVEFLGLRSLKYVAVEKFLVIVNRNLCYMENLTKRFHFLGAFSKVQNRDEEQCRVSGHVCHAQCDSAGVGCWGPGDAQCVRCRHFKVGHRCVPDCAAEPGYFAANATEGDQEEEEKEKKMVCKRCNRLCSQNCTGPGPDQCLGRCRFSRLNNTCVEKCPAHMYKNAFNVCLPCSSGCALRPGNRCTGPANRPGPGGCNHCTAAVVSNSTFPVIKRCFRATKLMGHYSRLFMELAGANKIVLKMEKGRKDRLLALVPCNPLCAECSSDGTRDCRRCRYFRELDNCVFNCSVNSYKVENTTSELVCQRCHPRCEGGCVGPFDTDCKSCKIMKIYSESAADKFKCASTCPTDLPYPSLDADGNSVCTKEPVSARMKSIIGSSTAVFVFVCVLISALCICFQRRRALAKKNRELATARYRRQLQEEMIPLKETDKQPNNQLLHLIGADQLRKGLEIGSGAFGTVFVGVWKPPKEKPTDEQVEIKVAIKTLKDGGSDGQSATLMTNEFLSEAHVMATVDHPFCISLLGVCMTSQIQLISDYMPLGSLVDYLPKHRQELGSQQLLTWAVQIAKGMVYLESLGIIHRDLAARNVLLESLQQVRITDFGLAKLMDEDVEFFAEGGRFPVKWLALECLRRRIFSHKSDVWAFGVTLWEIFTFGSRPYPDVRATELIDYLDRGERLLQPDICTLDIYMLMIKCWLADPEGRPTFEELVTDLSKMAADPARFLVVSTDGTLRAGTNRSNSAVSNASVGRHRSPHFPRASRSGTPDSGGRTTLAPVPNGTASASVSSNDDSMTRKPPARVAIPQPGLSHLADEVARRNAESRTRRPNSADLRYAALPSTSDENDVFEDYLTPTEGAADYLIPNQQPSSDYFDANSRPTPPQTAEYYNEVGPTDSPTPAYVNAPHLKGALATEGDYLNPQLLSTRRSPEYRMAGPIHDYCNTGPASALAEEADEEDSCGGGQADYLLPRKTNGGVANPHYAGVPLKKDKSPSRYLPLIGKRASPPKEMV